MPRNLKNLAESVKDRLRSYSVKHNQRFANVLTAFGHERLIYRLSISDYRDSYALKGGMLVVRWAKHTGRVTADVDFGVTIRQTKEKAITEFREILALEVPDGMAFDVENLSVHTIGRKEVFEGVRLKTIAYLNKTRIAIKIDIGTSDAVSPKILPFEYESILDFPSANILAYSPAFVLAEKFQAVMEFELSNGRLKDYFDLYTLRRELDISPTEMQEAIEETFGNRGTPVPTNRPLGLSSEFSDDPEKQQMWVEYSHRTEYSGLSLETVTNDIWNWLEPICRSIPKSS